MKLIGVLQGVAAYREVMEEYAPAQQVPLSDLVQTIRTAYQFQQFPVFPPNMAMPTTVLNFHNGKFAYNDKTFGVSQLVMTPKGDSVATGRTEDSDVVLNNLLELLDTKHGYRLRESTKTKIYWSHVVVEFDKGIEEHLGKIIAAENIISSRTANSKRYRFKGIAFSSSTSQPVITGDAIDFLETQDFVLERRVDVPFEQNRFFSSAPLSTVKHIEALEQIEVVLQN